MARPTISVVIPCYNYGLMLERAIMSVRNQSIQDVEIIIIDDASTDNTPQIAQRLLNSQTTYIRNPNNIGVYSSLNLGYKLATGEYCCQLDADDELTPDSLQTRYDYLRSTNKDAVHGGCIVVSNNTEFYIAPVDTGSKDSLLKFLNKSESADFGINNATFMYRRSLFDTVGWFDESLRYFPHNDYEFVLRVLSTSNVGLISKPLYRYNRHSNSHSDKYGTTRQSQEAYTALVDEYVTKFKALVV